jgi:phospholipid/cholesterol/gamma-HCH transport system substrate-binding protein
LTILIIGFKFLKGRNVFESSKIFYVSYHYVDQLSDAAPVYVNGLQVGTVIDVRLDPEDVKKVLVTLDVKNEIPVPNDAVAAIFSTGIISGKAIRLEFDQYCSGDNCAKSKTYLRGKVVGVLNSMLDENEMTKYLNVIGGKADSLLQKFGGPDSSNIMLNIQYSINNIRKITEQLDQVLHESNAALSQSFDNLAAITGMIRANSSKIDLAIANLADLSGQLKNANIGSVVNNADKTILSANKTIDELTATATQAKASITELNKVIASFNEGDGSLQLLMKDPKLYKNLESTSRNLDLLLQDIRLYPRRYLNISVFGGKKAGEAYEYPDGDPAKQK